jgi:hypothetical protein
MEDGQSRCGQWPCGHWTLGAPISGHLTMGCREEQCPGSHLQILPAAQEEQVCHIREGFVPWFSFQNVSGDGESKEEPGPLT